MLKVNTYRKFKKDLNIYTKRGYNLDALNKIVNILRIPENYQKRISIIIWQEITKDAKNAIFLLPFWKDGMELP